MTAPRAGVGQGPQPPTSPCANWRYQLASGWGAIFPRFQKSPPPLPGRGDTLCLPGGADPCQGWGLRNPGLPPPDPTRISTTEAQPNLSCEDFPTGEQEGLGPEASGEGSSPPLLAHLQYEEVWGTLPGREHRPGEVTARVLPKTSIFWTTAKGQTSQSPAGWSESLCSPGGGTPLGGAECQTCTGRVWFICSRMSWILLRIFFWWPAKVTPILSRSLETETQPSVPSLRPASQGSAEAPAQSLQLGGTLTLQSSGPPGQRMRTQH